MASSHQQEQQKQVTTLQASLYLQSHSGGSMPCRLWYEYDTTQRAKTFWTRSSPGAYPAHVATYDQLWYRLSLNGSGRRDGYHPGGTGTGQNRTVRRLCRMQLPPRRQQHLPCAPHGPVLSPWHLCMPTPT